MQSLKGNIYIFLQWEYHFNFLSRLRLNVTSKLGCQVPRELPKLTIDPTRRADCMEGIMEHLVPIGPPAVH